MANEQESWTVSEITRQIKANLETEFRSVAITGEISNLHKHSSGHLYFTLKDDRSQISAVLWRSRARTVRFQPEEGNQVLVTGRITLYEPRGQYQVEISSIRPVGVGELARLFEKVKAKLAEEGLFEPERKKPLPLFPESIGIVTSPTGAALQDMVSIINRRFPGVRLILSPVAVQGPSAAAEISEAIRDFNRLQNVDVMIIGRGGGSLEDLWPFNEEGVARAIAASSIPVISAVGHEVDFSIADFVADARAATPTAAAQMVVQDRKAILENLQRKWYLLHEMTEKMLDRYRDSIRSLTRSYAFSSPLDLMKQFNQRVDEVRKTLDLTMDHRISLTRSRCDSLSKRSRSLNPDLVLKRGYAIARKGERIISDGRLLSPGDTLDVRFHTGRVRSTVTEKL
ncbi:MAG: exodeoxyribonuclease VII large subunit [Ignavibacteria bacterium]|nr:exodeoxyribonuclease VII large subunit [Ignavibacteria bacterium]